MICDIYIICHAPAAYTGTDSVVVVCKIPTQLIGSHKGITAISLLLCTLHCYILCIFQISTSSRIKPLESQKSPAPVRQSWFCAESTTTPPVNIGCGPRKQFGSKPLNPKINFDGPRHFFLFVVPLLGGYIASVIPSLCGARRTGAGPHTTAMLLEQNTVEHSKHATT